MQISLVVVVAAVLAPTAVLSADIFNFLARDSSVWKCVTDFSEECVDRLGKKPVEQLFKARELHLGEFVSIEKVSNGSSEKREVIQNVWDVEELMDAAVRYMASHALKLKFGDLEARMFKSKTKPESVEVTVEARKRDSGKSQRIYRVIIPLVIGFKITGLVIFGIVTVKLFLLKASLVANTALLVAGGIVLKKLYDHGMGMLTQHQALLNTHHPMPSYYANGHDFSGYGYNGYNSNGFDSGSSSIHQEEGTEPSLEELPTDLHGQFSNHAIAMAALNKTIMQQQQQQQHQQMPKRRWSHRWSPWHSHR